LVELIEERVTNSQKHEGPGIRLATETIGLFKRTLARVRFNGLRRIEATDLFITLVMEEKSVLRELLSKLLALPQAKSKYERDFFAVVESVDAAGNTRKQQKYKYVGGERVRIKSGPFASFTGRVEMVDEDKWVLNVRVSIFGREQPVELRFIDVEKIDSIK
jgi:transcription antitermination factor NusG